MKLRIGGTVLVAVAVLVLGACSDSGEDNSASGDGLTAYRNCLASNGVTLPSFAGRPSGFPTARPTTFPTARPTGFPTVRPTSRPSGARGGFGNLPGVDPTAFAKAQEACASLRPTDQPGFGGNGRQGGDGRQAAYRNCLSEHGVTLQDGQRPNSADPKTAEALKTCEVLKPSPNPTGGASIAPTSPTN
jgi:hypothetical protein